MSPICISASAICIQSLTIKPEVAYIYVFAVTVATCLKTDRNVGLYSKRTDKRIHLPADNL